VWLLGRHRLLCGDARAAGTYEALLRGQNAQFTFTDPPYNVPIDGHACGLGRPRHTNFAMGCGEMSEAQFTAFLSTVLRLMATNAADGSIHAICMDCRHMKEILSAGALDTASSRTCASGISTMPAWVLFTGRSMS
jgi:hypothetical protein